MNRGYWSMPLGRKGGHYYYAGGDYSPGVDECG